MAHGALAAGFAEVIVNFVAENSPQLGPPRGFALETVLCFEPRQKGFLHEVFGDAYIAHLADGKVKKVIGVGGHPIAAGNWLALDVRHHSGCVFHNERTFCKVRATKLWMNMNCRNRL